MAKKEKTMFDVIHIGIEEINKNPNNPRIIKDDKFKKLVQSIKDFPKMLEMRPIVVNEHNIILGGNMRYEACKAAGLKTIPVIIAEDLTADEQRQFIIKDNVSGGEWDWEMLANEWEAEKLEEWGLDVPDFTGQSLDAEEDDFDTTPPEEPITVLGDLYEIGEHRLLCGDSTDSDQVAKLMNGEKADMVFTDPPWNVNYGAVNEGNPMGYKPRTILNDSMSTDDFKDFMGSAFAMMAMHSKKGCPTYVVMSAQEWGNLMLALHENGYHWSSTIIWNKSHLVMSRKDYHTKYEPIWYGWLDGAPRLCPVEDRKQSDVWDVDRPTKSELHPTTKPIELINIALKNSSKVGNLIMELFTGSGSTMVASHQLKRKCYGMELDPKYCDVIVKRMITLDPTLTIKLNGVDVTSEWK
jgi:DNA modification methylase